ncbi:hypothetical protein J2X11_001834 [Aeromicrobium panaciterrae]|uniref:DUF4919 domain-containing protein n=1 Tax=Aeromicrobium panaciterrae TaxID=363861 RepID=A0ABU1UPB4_9ACTN|nr:hypothetical protein [Aeromicrobium panaciterrae]MDR7086995.1 hypothetical protein [Aeromicrobium panaciterrae]
MSKTFFTQILPLLFSVFSVVLSGYMSVRQQRISAKLRLEENRREKQESALAAAQRVYEPMAQAAAELQSRIYNIVENDWVTLTKRYEGHGDYPTKSTAFLFAHYFGWVEARRQSVLDSSGKGGRDDTVQNLIDGVTKIMRRGDDSEGFSFFSAEQRAIGELMFFWEVVPDSGLRIPHVLGYAAFSTRYKDDPAFREWFSPVDAGMARVAEGDNTRLIDIQGALVHLILELDPNQRYTTGYDLKPIGAEAGWKPPVPTDVPAEEQPTQ